MHSFIHSVFIYYRNINLKIYKNQKIVNRNKTDQIYYYLYLYLFIARKTFLICNLTKNLKESRLKKREEKLILCATKILEHLV